VTWTIEFERAAAKEFRKLESQAQRRIRNFLEQRILTGESPRIAGSPLHGTHSSLWRYRVGPFRVIVDIQDDRMIVLVVRVAHRRDIYN